MIFIDLFGNPPPQELIDEGERLTDELMALSPDQRADFIDRHADYWGKLKDHYLMLSHGKCWYTEAKEIASHYHMDHFRPKKSINHLEINCPIETTNSNTPYWWLAFDWKNYRVMASIPNSTKGGYFPLQKGSRAASNNEELAQEWPGLLDPADEYDVSLIGFDLDGKVYPACSDFTSWDAQRVELSKRVYNLNCQSLVDKRIEIQQTCKAKILQIKKAQRKYADTQSDEFRELLKNCVRELRAMTKPDAELSAVARNYIRNDPEEFIRNIAC